MKLMQRTKKFEKLYGLIRSYNEEEIICDFSRFLVKKKHFWKINQLDKTKNSGDNVSEERAKLVKGVIIAMSETHLKNKKVHMAGYNKNSRSNFKDYIRC